MIIIRVLSSDKQQLNSRVTKRKHIWWQNTKPDSDLMEYDAKENTHFWQACYYFPSILHTAHKHLQTLPKLNSVLLY